jgi:hypothetical protein
MAFTFVEDRYHATQLIKATWTSDSDGAASGTTTAVDWDGVVVLLETTPGSGSDAPTTLYDLTVTDKHGRDVLCGAGANRSATATEYVHTSDLGTVSCSQLIFTIAASGDITKGTIYLSIIGN